MRPLQHSSFTSLLQTVQVLAGSATATDTSYVSLCRQKYLVSLLHLESLQRSPLGGILVKHTGIRLIACPPHGMHVVMHFQEDPICMMCVLSKGHGVHRGLVARRGT